MNGTRDQKWTRLDLSDVEPPTRDEIDVGGRIATALRRVAEREAIDLGGGAVAGQRLAAIAARDVGTHVPALIAVEVGSAALAAPWLTTSDATATAIASACGVAERLLPMSPHDVGRDAGTWGAVTAAVAIDAVRGLRRSAEVANLAAALVLERVPGAEPVERYVALRAGHAASTGLLSVSLADAGFVADSESLATMVERLGTGGLGAAEAPRGRLGREAAEVMERSLR